ncbi:Hypothetical protein P9211_07491 [Prochlorococcus marinus str. MIT 9211]|uniref:Aminoglycoside phosphotransferase domain-containing protein n=1 Tax=Prochlorococcus marinus (strain MIT 9211) TaxID=93059 RepID=A9BA18_PROM4|nr:Hypothetical protein P9211_07491 [Prochlorococcus marinus str. MIT 9211]
MIGKSDTSKKDLYQIALYFSSKGIVKDIQLISSGNINNTYLVRCSEDSCFEIFILQTINTRVFSSPIALINNHLIFLDYIQEIENNRSDLEHIHLTFPRLLLNSYSNDYLLKYKEKSWRAFEFVPQSKTILCLSSSKQAYEVGKALGAFHSLSHSFPLHKLSKSIDSLHSFGNHLSNFYNTIQNKTCKQNSQEELKNRVDTIISFIKNNKDKVINIDSLFISPPLSFGLIHGDTKSANFLFDELSDQILSIIDMDTIQSGYLIYDIADCCRSCCNQSGEEPKDTDLINFDLIIFGSILKGYLLYSDKLLNKNDLKYLPATIYSITFELAIRFFTDYLSGDTYFETTYPKQNLFRAEVQLALLQDIQQKWEDIKEIVTSLASDLN